MKSMRPKLTMVRHLLWAIKKSAPSGECGWVGCRSVCSHLIDTYQYTHIELTKASYLAHEMKLIEFNLKDPKEKFVRIITGVLYDTLTEPEIYETIIIKME
jgi:hypothetical protein